MNSLFNFFAFITIIITPTLGVFLNDNDSTTPQIVAQYGYTPEIHHVTTEDGYILEMHRIVSSPKFFVNSSDSQSKNVVFVQHGILSSSIDFVIAGPNVALGYYLADLGYDVWLGNSRGNQYCRNHTSLSSDQSAFWEFSWHEMGVYDLTASIDYILNVTKHETLTYIGFSQGTTMFFVMCTERPQYQEKINLMQALAPVVYLHRTENDLVRTLGYSTNSIVIKYIKLPAYEFPPLQSIWRTLGRTLCSTKLTKLICLEIIFQFFGTDYKYFDYDLLALYTKHFFSGVSNLCVAHFGQMANEDRFGQLDYGPLQNMKKYGQSTPPNYDLSTVKVPVMLIYSQNDVISAPIDVFRLRDTLPNLVEYYEPLYKEYNHGDYILGIGARETVYNKMVEVLKQFSIE